MVYGKVTVDIDKLIQRIEYVYEDLIQKKQLNKEYLKLFDEVSLL